MEDDQQQPAYLFMVRLWSVGVSDGQHVWRGAVKHLPTGELYHFRDWDHLGQRLEAILAYQAGPSWPQSPDET